MMRYKAVFVAVAMAMAFSAFAVDPTITVEARQRYPWNGLVDLKFAVTGTSGTKYDTSFTAKDVVGSTNITMATVYKEDGTLANVAKESLLPGTYNWVWDAAADLPKDFKCDRVTVTGTTVEPEPLYMVIDLSGGANASSYPVSYLADVPSSGWTDTYKTTKLVLRRVKKGTNSAGGSMTKDMWVGVFELTERQYKLIVGPNINVEQSWVDAYPHTIGTYPTRAIFSMNESSGPVHIDRNIKARTGVKARFATSMEWEYACRAGTTTAYNNGKSATAANMNLVGWYKDNIPNTKSGSYILPQVVGLKEPNAWGLYDMHGNLAERVYLNASASYPSYYCGGSLEQTFDNCKSSSKEHYEDHVTYFGRCGIRVFADVE